MSAKRAAERMSDEQIKYMVNRFLTWRFPDDFNPDGGISFRPYFNEHTAYPMKAEPVGTNLLDAMQAEAMIRHLIDGMPAIISEEAGASLNLPRLRRAFWEYMEAVDHYGANTTALAEEICGMLGTSLNTEPPIVQAGASLLSGERARFVQELCLARTRLQICLGRFRGCEGGEKPHEVSLFEIPAWIEDINDFLAAKAEPVAPPPHPLEDSDQILEEWDGPIPPFEATPSPVPPLKPEVLAQLVAAAKETEGRPQVPQWVRDAAEECLTIRYSEEGAWSIGMVGEWRESIRVSNRYPAEMAHAQIRGMLASFAARMLRRMPEAAAPSVDTAQVSQSQVGGDDLASPLAQSDRAADNTVTRLKTADAPQPVRTQRGPAERKERKGERRITHVEECACMRGGPPYPSYTHDHEHPTDERQPNSDRRKGEAK